jgi:tripartite ATP-independent transporter DctP family solute receptor
MRKGIALVIATALLCTLAVPAVAAGYKDEYKMDVVPGPATAWGMGAQYFADLVKEKSGGKINIKVYFGSQLSAGKQTSAFLLLRNGAIDFALQSVINWSPQVKELNLTAMPFFIASRPDRFKAVDAIKAGKSGKMLIDAIEKKGVKFLGWGENGFRELTNSKRPVTSPADLQGLKIRVVGSPIYIDIYNALGANPINMNWAEATTAFQQGVVDGQENPISIFFPLKIYEYHKFVTDWHYVIDPLLLCVNPDVWKSFPEQDRKMLQECVDLASKYQIAIARVGLDGDISLKYLQSIGKVPEITNPYAALEKAGMTVTKLTPEQIKAFAEKTKPVAEKWRKELGEELIKAAEEDMASVK